MLDTLANIYDDGGHLVGVSYTLFEGDPKFVTACAGFFKRIAGSCSDEFDGMICFRD
jgi:hypothetical protein